MRSSLAWSSVAKSPISSNSTTPPVARGIKSPSFRDSVGNSRRDFGVFGSTHPVAAALHSSNGGAFTVAGGDSANAGDHAESRSATTE